MAIFDTTLWLDNQICPWPLCIHGICEQYWGFSRLEHFQQNSVNHLQNSHWISKYFFGREMLTVFCLNCYAWVITLSGAFSHFEIPFQDSSRQKKLLLFNTHNVCKTLPGLNFWFFQISQFFLISIKERKKKSAWFNILWVISYHK